MTGPATVSAALTDGFDDLAFDIRDLAIRYKRGAPPVVRELDLPVHESKVTALIGASGSGKSTLLRALNRMHDLNPDASVTGSITLHGVDINGPRVDPCELRRTVGMVFQTPNPFPKSIRANVLFGPTLHTRLTRAEGDEIVEDSLRKAGLWEEVKDRLKSSALSLSGGQQQRLCIARTIATAPDVILMDEPCSALDPMATRNVEALIRTLSSEQGFTILLVTHSMHQAKRASDFTAFLDGGELIEFGTTRQIFEDPQNQRTRDYILGRFG